MWVAPDVRPTRCGQRSPFSSSHPRKEDRPIHLEQDGSHRPIGLRRDPQFHGIPSRPAGVLFLHSPRLRSRLPAGVSWLGGQRGCSAHAAQPDIGFDHTDSSTSLRPAGTCRTSGAPGDQCSGRRAATSRVPPLRFLSQSRPNRDRRVSGPARALPARAGCRSAPGFEASPARPNSGEQLDHTAQLDHRLRRFHAEAPPPSSVSCRQGMSEGRSMPGICSLHKPPDAPTWPPIDLDLG
jgi:hypothetical protein